MKRAVAVLCASLLTGCYSHQRVELGELEKLTAAPGRPAELEISGAGCGGCTIVVDATSPLVLTTRSGSSHRMTPFFFHMSDNQIVSPDFGVLLNRAQLERAEVRQLSTMKTVALVALVAGVAVGTFVGIRATAGEESLRTE